ncbi:50S ribosomal protein L25/general stress protein Ctc [Limibacter armeniacum]|uniref:50S ribosomal protein L25/general stress protein Ctc n=1 Tax=Limibacter armeniacum TaxID=466084 RepID=UPI002FE58000
MKTVEVVGFKRADLGKTVAKRLRAEGNVPCVVYGKGEPVHFYAPMYLFREVVYTPEACFVKLNIEGEEKIAIIQDTQFHPVSETLMHADFLELQDDKPVKMEIPVSFVGTSPGLQMGGKLVAKLRKLKVRALPANMPQTVEVSVEGLDLGKSVKVAAVEAKDFEILYNPSVTIASIAIPRALRSAQSKAQ